MTDTERNELLTHFYWKQLLPAAERLREKNVQFFSLAPDREHPPATYFEAHRDHITASYVFELDDLPSSSWLQARWVEHPDLLVIVEPVVGLSRMMEQREEESGEISPLIYAMF